MAAGSGPSDPRGAHPPCPGRCGQRARSPGGRAPRRRGRLRPRGGAGSCRPAVVAPESSARAVSHERATYTRATCSPVPLRWDSPSYPQARQTRQGRGPGTPQRAKGCCGAARRWHERATKEVGHWGLSQQHMRPSSSPNHSLWDRPAGQRGGGPRQRRGLLAPPQRAASSRCPTRQAAAMGRGGTPGGAPPRESKGAVTASPRQWGQRSGLRVRGARSGRIRAVPRCAAESSRAVRGASVSIEGGGTRG